MLSPEDLEADYEGKPSQCIQSTSNHQSFSVHVLHADQGYADCRYFTGDYGEADQREADDFPVAGIRQRGKSIEEDQALEKELLADEKECAEHNMLVDLARNDLGRIAEYGSVKVADYMAIHRFSKVMHIAKYSGR